MLIGFRNSVIRNLLQTNSICDYTLVCIWWYIFGSVDGHHNGPERLFPDLDDLPLAFLLVMIHPGAIKNENCLYQVFLAISCHIFQLFIANISSWNENLNDPLSWLSFWFISHTTKKNLVFLSDIYLRIIYFLTIKFRCFLSRK